MIPVDSSYIHGVEFIENSNTLIVEFIRGAQRRWRYAPVTRDAYVAMMSSSSVGSYFASNIRNNPDITAEPEV